MIQVLAWLTAGHSAEAHWVLLQAFEAARR